jgi:DHA2 family multidrug resistance protein
MSATALPLRADRYANKWPIAFAVTLGAVIELIDTSIINVALPHISANLGATIEEVTWVSVGYILAAVIVLPMTGWLSAFFGRTRYYIGSIILFTIASFLCGASRSLEVLVLCRIIQGIGGGALIATSQAILYESFPPDEQTLAAAIFGIGMMIGPAIGPTLGGIIVDRYDWPWIFYINIPIGFVATIMILTFVKDPVHEHKAGRFDFVGFTLLAAGLGCLQFVLERGEHYDWFESNLIRWLTGTATVMLVSLIWWELHIDQPMINLRLLKHRSLAAGCLAMGAVGLALYGSIFAVPLLTQNLLGYDAATTGWVLFPGAVGSAIGMFGITRLPKNIDRRLIAATGALILVVAMFMHGQFTTMTGRQQLFWPIVLRGVGAGLMFVPLAASTVAGLKGPDMAQGSAMFNLARQLGGSFGLAWLATQLTTATAVNRANLVTYVTSTNPEVQRRLAMLTAAMQSRVGDPVLAARQARAILDRMVQAQALILTYDQLFRIVGVVIFCCLPLIFLQKKPSGGAPSDLH